MLRSLSLRTRTGGSLARVVPSRRPSSHRKIQMMLTATSSSSQDSSHHRRPLSPDQSRCYSTVLASTCAGSHFHKLNSWQANNNNNDHHHFQIRTKVFVSRHNQSLNISASQIIEYCNTHNIDTTEHRATMSHVILKECPFCSKPTAGKASNFYKLYIQIGGGAYFCHRCGTNGSWYDFKSTVGGYSIDSMSSNNAPLAAPQGTTNQTLSQPSMPITPPSSAPGLRFGRGNNGGNGVDSFPGSSSSTQPLPMPKARLSSYYSSRLLDPQNEGNDVLNYLTKERGLDRKILRLYGVGRAEYQFPSDQGGYISAECVTFPWILKESEVQDQESFRGATFTPSTTSSYYHGPAKKTKEEKKEQDSSTEDPNDDKLLTRRIKARALQRKSWQRLDPPGGGWGLFGWHTIPQDATQVVLTEGEYDAMAVHQATGLPAISLPNGCRSLPLAVLPLLEKFEKIFLWMDSDLPGQEGAAQFAKKLGINRCYLVKTSQAKDANEALLKKLDLHTILEQASLMPHERILTFGDLRQDVLHELLQPELYTGSPIPSLPGFTKLIKGFRRGEVTVLTGPTGSGKTTFLGQVSLDLAEQGINVLWGSFEIKNTRLLHKLLKQFARNPLPDHKDPKAPELLGALADRFQDLPLYFMKFHGGSEVDEVLDAMEYAVYVNDVEHIILDNMQFMISRNAANNNSKFDKFDIQDMAIEKFRKFATEHNVHLTLVVHPRKEDEASKLNISSFYGSAKATQEADTVLILQHDGRRKYIDVKKNRFDGTLGYAPLHFQAASGRYVETEGGYNNADASKGGPQQQQQQQQQDASSVEFFGPKQKWKSMKKEPEEPEPEGLEHHWETSLNLAPLDKRK